MRFHLLHARMLRLKVKGKNSKEVTEREHLQSVVGNGNLYRYFNKQYGGSSKTKKLACIYPQAVLCNFHCPTPYPDFLPPPLPAIPLLLLGSILVNNPHHSTLVSLKPNSYNLGSIGSAQIQSVHLYLAAANLQTSTKS